MTDARTRSIEEEVFLRLSESSDFMLYLGLLSENSQKIARSLRKPLSNEKDVADHNYMVGMLAGLSTAMDLVRTRLATLNGAMK